MFQSYEIVELIKALTELREQLILDGGMSVAANISLKEDTDKKLKLLISCIPDKKEEIISTNG